jgi:tetratricopeptide (TPR) repeat protein
VSENIREQLQKTLGHAYTLERELGGGGMSRVFVAEENSLRRKVVVKVLPPELTAGVNVERFNREILLAAKLQHPNIVQVLTAGETNGLPYYTMPLVEGESLRGRLSRTNALSITEAVSILKDVARALAYAHERGIVHRDIKPDNVLITGGAATVTDFGIAKAISASRTQGSNETLTQIGTSIGTPTYMSPEQAAGDPTTDHRTDLYSFGCMAYELLAGQPPFNEKTPRKLLAAHMGEKPRDVTELRPDTPASLAELVMRCLGKEADDRPQSASDLVRVLETVTSGGTSPAAPAVLLGGKGMFRKALAIYAAAFVAVAILAKAAIVGIGLPDWVFPGSLIVMALGLPVILWTGYVHRVARRAMTMTPTYTPGGTPSMAQGTIATIALKAAPKMSWYKTARGGMYALGGFIVLVGAAMGMRAADIGPFATLRGALGKQSSLILTDFRTSANTDSTLGRVVSDAIRAGLTGSKVFSVTPQSAINAALTRMQRPPTTRIDSAVAREIALRDGLKAIVDGEITGVTGGYIVAVRLVRADSGIELASFRETGDGPRGLIDAADKLARALRSKAGESLREVNGTPALAQATTSSLEALRKFSEASRANSAGDRAALQLAREAVALDSTFATGWAALAGMISNWGGSPSSRDSAMTQAYRYRDRLPARERELVTARYYNLGPGRDRTKSAAAYQSVIDQGDSTVGTINLGEVLRTRREYARAESLNLISSRLNPTNVIAIGNTYELQVNQGKMKEAEATLAKWAAMSRTNVMTRRMAMHFFKGEYEAQRRLADSLTKSADAGLRQNGANNLANLALLGGQLRERTRLRNVPGLIPTRVGGVATEAGIQAALRGPSPALLASLDSAVAATRFAEIPQVDRQYLAIATGYARLGKPAQASAMLARFRAEVTDTSLRRVLQPDEQNVVAEIAMADGKPMDAVAAFRRGDIGFDGAPANECNVCLPLSLARAYDAAAQPDSAIANFELYLRTSFWLKSQQILDPLNVPLIRERLGQLYEAKGNPAKAAENYRAFIELWKNADPELQPRVKAAKDRLAKLNPVEGAPKR